MDKNEKSAQPIKIKSIQANSLYAVNNYVERSTSKKRSGKDHKIGRFALKKHLLYFK